MRLLDEGHEPHEVAPMPKVGRRTVRRWRWLEHDRSSALATLLHGEGSVRAGLAGVLGVRGGGVPIHAASFIPFRLLRFGRGTRCPGHRTSS